MLGFKKLTWLLLCAQLSACATNHQVDKEQDPQTKVAEINIQLGLKYLEMKNYSRAKQKLLLALEENPKLPETNYALAYFYEASGDKKLADQYYLNAIALAPKRGDVQNNYGTFLCRSGQYKEAIRHFEMAAQDKEYLDPASAYENAGWCALKIPNKNLAINYFNLSVMNDPSRVSALHEWQKLTNSKE